MADEWIERGRRPELPVLYVDRNRALAHRGPRRGYRRRYAERGGLVRLRRRRRTERERRRGTLQGPGLPVNGLAYRFRGNLHRCVSVRLGRYPKRMSHPGEGASDL